MNIQCGTSDKSDVKYMSFEKIASFFMKILKFNFIEFNLNIITVVRQQLLINSFIVIKLCIFFKHEKY